MADGRHRPCPWCGSTLVRVCCETGGAALYVLCDRCGARGPRAGTALTVHPSWAWALWDGGAESGFRATAEEEESRKGR